MAKAWIIIKGWGSYSDRGTRPVRVYLNYERAKADMTKLDAIYKKYQPIILPPGRFIEDFDAVKKLTPQIKAEYEAAGFKAEWNNDWELEEADLDLEMKEK